jgi:hypothetical protein
MTVEFDCIDCGWHVVNAVGTLPRTRCLSCEWLAESPLVPAERERLRAILSPPLARGPPSEAPS